MATIHWASAINGDFSNPGDWVGGTPPGSGDVAAFDATGPEFTVTVSGVVLIAGATLGPNATLAIDDDLKIFGTLYNGGVVLVDSNDRLDVRGNGLTLSGGGAIKLRNGFFGGVYGSEPPVLTNVDNTITGSGTVGNVDLVKETNGVLDATGGLNISTHTIMNLGVIEASGGGTLTGATFMVIDQFGGEIVAGSGSTVNLSRYGVEVVGGVIKADVGGKVILDSGLLSGVALKTIGSGQIQVNASLGLDGTSAPVQLYCSLLIPDKVSLSTNGRIYNTGQITLAGASQFSPTKWSLNSTTLTGGGRVVLGNAYDTTAGSLTNVDNFISGAGQLGQGSGVITNEAAGIILGDKSDALTLATGANTIVNAGEIISSGAGGVTIKSVLDNTGLLYASLGNLTVQAAVVGAATVKIYGATADFTGNFGENVTFVANASKTGTLELVRNQTYGGVISGFSKSGMTALDLAYIALPPGRPRPATQARPPVAC